jgi:hypothetical protein
MNINKKCNYIKRWCAVNDKFFLKAAYEFPPETIDECKQIYDEGYFVRHRGGQSAGWQSCALHGWGINEPEYYRTMNPSGYGFTEEEVVWGFTEIAEIAPKTKKFLEDTFDMDTMRRCRFMLLEPGGWIQAHDDGKTRSIWSAINGAITQPEDCYLRRADTLEEVPFKPLQLFYYDNRVIHEAKNNSDKPRFHFIIHGFKGNKTKQVLVDSFEKKYGEIKSLGLHTWHG